MHTLTSFYVNAWSLVTRIWKRPAKSRARRNRSSSENPDRLYVRDSSICLERVSLVNPSLVDNFDRCSYHVACSTLFCTPNENHASSNLLFHHIWSPKSLNADEKWLSGSNAWHVLANLHWNLVEEYKLNSTKVMELGMYLLFNDA